MAAGARGRLAGVGAGWRARASASRRRCRSPPGWCSRSTPSRAGFVPHAGRAARAGRCWASAAVLLALVFPGDARCTSRLALAAAALAARHRLLRPVRRGGGACLAAGARRTPDAPAAARRRSRGGVPLLRWSGSPSASSRAGFVAAVGHARCSAAWFAERRGAGTTRPCSRCWPGWSSPACWPGARASAGAAGAPTRWLYAGAALLLLAYVGSRFVLEVVLHRADPEETMKYLVVLLVVVLWLWLGARRGARRPPRKPPPARRPPARGDGALRALRPAPAAQRGAAGTRRALLQRRAPRRPTRPARNEPAGAPIERRRPSAASSARVRGADADESWFGAVGVTAEAAPLDDGWGDARRVALRRGWHGADEAGRLALPSRQARRIVTSGRRRFERLYRAFIGARAAIGLALLVRAGRRRAAGTRPSLVVAGAVRLLCAAAVALWLARRACGRCRRAIRWRGSASRQWLATIGVDLLVLLAAARVRRRRRASTTSPLLVLPVLMAGVLTPRLLALGTAAGRDAAAARHAPGSACSARRRRDRCRCAGGARRHRPLRRRAAGRRARRRGWRARS